MTISIKLFISHYTMFDFFQECSKEILQYLESPPAGAERHISSIQSSISAALKGLYSIGCVSFLVYLVAPLHEDRIFLLDAWYPVSVNSTYFVTFTLVQQALTGIQIIAGLTFDLIMNIFYLYPAIRMFALTDKFRNKELRKTSSFVEFIVDQQHTMRSVHFTLIRCTVRGGKLSR